MYVWAPCVCSACRGQKIPELKMVASFHVGAGNRTRQALLTALRPLQVLASCSFYSSDDGLLGVPLLATANNAMVSEYLSPCFQFHYIHLFVFVCGIFCLLLICRDLNILLHCGGLDKKCPPSALRGTPSKTVSSPLRSILSPVVWIHNLHQGFFLFHRYFRSACS